LTSTTASTDLSAAATRDERRVGLLVPCLLALGIGIMTGIDAVILRSLIGLIHNAMFNGVFKIPYDANVLEGPSRWGNWVFLSPILGGLVLRTRIKARVFVDFIAAREFARNDLRAGCVSAHRIAQQIIAEVLARCLSPIKKFSTRGRRCGIWLCVAARGPCHVGDEGTRWVCNS
jgi:hypothetical protein